MSSYNLVKEPSNRESMKELWKMGRKEGFTRLDMVKIIFWTELYVLKDYLFGPDVLTDEEHYELYNSDLP